MNGVAVVFCTHNPHTHNPHTRSLHTHAPTDPNVPPLPLLSLSFHFSLSPTQAKVSLQMAASFFSTLCRRAKEEDCAQYAMLQRIAAL